jgi:undecaprenyl-diphosphatase
MKKFWIYTSLACVLLVAFAVLTVSLTFVDVREAGESGAEVGFASLNEAVFEALGQDEISLKLSNLCGALLIAVVGAFGVTGLVQVIRRKGIWRADKELYVMAVGLVLLAAAYLFFEIVVINCRPVLEEGELAASYPSSHAMLAASVAGMGAAYLFKYLKPKFWHGLLCGFLVGLACVTVSLRLFGGVHWLTDIVGGVLLGLVITFAYLSVCALLAQKGKGHEG